MALPSSFVNVTLSFWTNENGFAIAPPESHTNNDNSLSNRFLSSSSSSSSATKELQEEKEADLPLNAHAFVSSPQHEKQVDSKDSKNSINSIVENLISDLWKDRASESKLGVENETNIASLLESDIVGNVSRLAKNVIENATNQANDTFRCLPSDLTLGGNQCLWGNNSTDNTTDAFLDQGKPEKVYWALFLVILPILALFGNILVILRERSLQTVTNWFIVSLAFADLFVTIPMLFSTYVMVNVDWELSQLLCDLYIAIDVICSTASIFNLVAISLDRYIAVTHPIFYSKHKNDKRVIFTIVIVWIASTGVGVPIILGANNLPDRIPELCIFYNSNFIIYSSLWSFYIPCVLMVVLYYKIFRAIHDRAKKAIGNSQKTYSSGTSDAAKTALVIENVAQTKKIKDQEEGNSSINLNKAPAAIISNNTKNVTTKLPLIAEIDKPTNTGTGNTGSDDPNDEDGDGEDEEDEEEEGLGEIVECHIIKNEQTEKTEYMLNVKRNERDKDRMKSNLNMLSPIEVEVTFVPNGNTDSGYAPSNCNIEETQFCVVQNPNAESPEPEALLPRVGDRASNSKSGTAGAEEADTGEDSNKNGTVTKVSSSSQVSQPGLQATSHVHNYPAHHQQNTHHQHNESASHSGSTIASTTGTTGATNVRQAKKKSRFNLGRKHKSSRKKREKASAKRERKATKTLAIVLGVFLLCWTPFFSCNILDAICIKLHDNEYIERDCRIGMVAFLLTTWLGYLNSCVNPLIYTIFNPEFRKAFNKILAHPFAC